MFKKININSCITKTILIVVTTAMCSTSFAGISCEKFENKVHEINNITWKDKTANGIGYVGGTVGAAAGCIVAGLFSGGMLCPVGVILGAKGGHKYTSKTMSLILKNASSYSHISNDINFSKDHTLSSISKSLYSSISKDLNPIKSFSQEDLDDLQFVLKQVIGDKLYLNKLSCSDLKGQNARETILNIFAEIVNSMDKVKFNTAP